jgi:cytochrome c5
MNLEKEQNVLFELIAIIVGAIVGGILFISFLTYDFKSDASSNVMVESKIKENIQPVAKVELAQAVAEGSASAGKSGEEVYKAVCSMCHQAGILNAPKLGDTQAWASRISQGYETLVQHAIKGIRSMPAKGGNASLSDAEVAGAVLYMTNSSGANFKK